MVVDADDFERLSVASMELEQNGQEHLFHRQFGRFERTDSAPNDPSLGMAREWKWAHWLEDGWATVMLAKQFLIDNRIEFELFYDTSYPTQWGGYVIFTDYNRR